MPINLDGDAKGGPSMQMRPGEYDATIAKVITMNKDGDPLMTKEGDRKILVVYENDDRMEALDSTIVEGKGVWKIARLLSALGYHDEELAGEGIREYTDFLDKKTADRLLLGRKVRIRVVARVYNGQTYANVDVLGPDLGGAKPVTTDISDADRVGIETEREDIPF